MVICDIENTLYIKYIPSAVWKWYNYDLTWQKFDWMALTVNDFKICRGRQNVIQNTNIIELHIPFILYPHYSLIWQCSPLLKGCHSFEMKIIVYDIYYDNKFVLISVNLPFVLVFFNCYNTSVIAHCPIISIFDARTQSRWTLSYLFKYRQLIMFSI